MNPLNAPILSAETTDDSAYESAMAFLFGRLNYERSPEAATSLADFPLARMADLLRRLDDPQLAVPIVHIAGSKGKGSTATMVARILEAAGYRVGLFTSPHVECFEERFSINGRYASRQAVVQLVNQVRQSLDENEPAGSSCRPTFFELATAIGWLHFQQQKVDIAVVEVGLGGRLDSTNLCKPLVTAITSISRDHMRLLGNTLESIAREKAGIIKPGVPLISGVSAASLNAIFQEMAADRNATVLQVNEAFRIAPIPPGPPPYDLPATYGLHYDSAALQLQEVPLGMPGAHQTMNAGVAITAAALLRDHGFTIEEAAIRRGLQNARCPLRVEVLSRNPLTIVDVAHNPASIQALCDTLQTVAAERRIAIFAASRDKEIDALLRILDGNFDEIILTQYGNNPRCCPIEELSQMAESLLQKSQWSTAPSVTQALQQARQTSGPGDLICAAGSFFLASEAQQILTQTSADIASIEGQ